MSTQLSVQETFKQKISENLKNQFMELLPPEMLDELTKVAFDEFVNGSIQKRLNNKNYDPSQDPDTLKGMIMLELRNLAKEEIRKVFQGPEWTAIWNPNNTNPSNMYVMQAVNDIVTANADAFVQALFKGVVSSIMMPMINNIRNGQF